MTIRSLPLIKDGRRTIDLPITDIHFDLPLYPTQVYLKKYLHPKSASVLLWYKQKRWRESNQTTNSARSKTPTSTVNRLVSLYCSIIKPFKAVNKTFFQRACQQEYIWISLLFDAENFYMAVDIKNKCLVLPDKQTDWKKDR